MRVATFVISILVVVIILLQACAVFGLGSLSDTLSGEESPTETTGGGAVGILVGLLAFVAMAFVLKFPGASVVLYTIAGLLAFVNASTGFSDMTVWGVVLLVLAVLSFFGRRELRKARRGDKETIG